MLDACHAEAASFRIAICERSRVFRLRSPVAAPQIELKDDGILRPFGQCFEDERYLEELT